MYLIDADTYIWKLAYFNEDILNKKIVYTNVIKYMNVELNKLKVLDNSNYQLIFSSSKNFRYDIDSEYKANRKDKKQYVWLRYIKEILKETYINNEKENYEADDLIATLAKNSDYKDIIVHIDKDLLQIPGVHIYRNKVILVSQIEAYTFIMNQICYYFFTGSTFSRD